MALSDSIDLYCERTDPGMWAEPVNALTNAAFFVAAWLLARELATLRRAGTKPPASISALPSLLALIGLCSLLFHTLGTMWAGLADQLAILLYGCVFLYAFLRHPARLGVAVAASGAIAFSLLSYFTPRVLPAGFLNQSGAYLPYLAGLSGIAAWLRAHRRPAFGSFVTGIGLFLVALTVRTIDPLVCERFPLGTHFAWHLLNGAVLYLLSAGLAREVDGPMPHG